MAAPIDNFNDGVRAAFWTENITAGSSTTETGGYAQHTGDGVITPSGHALWDYNAAAFDLVANPSYIKPTHVSGNSQVIYELSSAPGSGSDNAVIMRYTQGNGALFMVRREAGTETSGTSITYSATDHAWWRMLIDATDIRYQTAPDAGNTPGAWTDRRLIAHAGAITTYPVKPRIGCRDTNSDVTVARFDGLNTVAGAGTGPAGRLVQRLPLVSLVHGGLAG